VPFTESQFSSLFPEESPLGPVFKHVNSVHILISILPPLVLSSHLRLGIPSGPSLRVFYLLCFYTSRHAFCTPCQCHPHTWITIIVFGNEYEPACCEFLPLGPKYRKLYLPFRFPIYFFVTHPTVPSVVPANAIPRDSITIIVFDKKHASASFSFLPLGFQHSAQ
jgi:hypothetical protein